MEEQIKNPSANEQLAGIEKRRKRIQRIKRVLVISLGFLLLFPNVTCIFLLYSNYQMNLKIDRLMEALSTQQISKVENPVLNNGEQIYKENLETELLTYTIPDSEMYEGKNRIYLTFDDGPSTYTGEILDILKEYQVKATFFVLAKEGYDAEYKRIVDEGHTLALHSFTHKYSAIYETPQAFEEDVRGISDFVYDKTGVRSSIYRFPGGSSNTVVQFDKEELFGILRKEGLSYFDWNVSSQDATSQRLAAATIVKNVLQGVDGREDSVVLMHDAADKYTTVEALPMILEELLSDENNVILPITQGTTPVRHVISVYEETEE
ncbi:MAG: polysaccharide deacetylase [Lachnospiraceae bacterium]|nr:polysaccharide deacetylase [Lachnospiraceae bacterium]